ncbi:multiple organellar RNA editing factor 9, chloroplastic [Iris pallida]|uniref:Multiple organellar RNA editing factor 9, chloroplastic n=1 Tax=Iris pallida TaxID=29817 RepID=A0AAX6I1M0_IRIPA|nr:multiple organellar RNA editing factor 9, chloroplastic [Iris pallida]
MSVREGGGGGRGLLVAEEQQQQRSEGDDHAPGVRLQPLAHRHGVPQGPGAHEGADDRLLSQHPRDRRRKNIAKWNVATASRAKDEENRLKGIKNTRDRRTRGREAMGRRTVDLGEAGPGAGPQMELGLEAEPGAGPQMELGLEAGPRAGPQMDLGLEIALEAGPGAGPGGRTCSRSWIRTMRNRIEI